MTDMTEIRCPPLHRYGTHWALLFALFVYQWAPWLRGTAMILLFTTSVMGIHWLRKYDFCGFYKKTYNVPAWMLHVGDIVTHWVPFLLLCYSLRTDPLTTQDVCISLPLAWLFQHVYLKKYPLLTVVYPVSLTDLTQSFVPLMTFIWLCMITLAWNPLSLGEEFS